MRRTFFERLAEDTKQYRKENYMLTFKEAGKESIMVHYNNGVFLGHFYVEVDGFWVFVPHTKGGCWSGPILKMLYEKLHELNKGWEAELTKQLKENPIMGEEE